MQARVWVAALVSLAAGCTKTVVVTCDIDQFASADIVGRGDVAECGAALDSDGGTAPAAWAAAHQCVLDAVAAGHTFLLRYDTPDPVKHLRTAFTGYGTGGGRVNAHVFVSSADQPGDANPTVSSTPCSGTPPFVDTNSDPRTPCTPGVGNPCLTCNTTLPGTLLCGFQR